METPEQIQSLEDGCESLLALPKMRFVGIINKMGKLVFGKFKKGVTSYLNDKEDGMAYMEFAMEVFLRGEFDEKLGAIDYVLSKRKKISVISMPVGKYLIIISTEPDAEVEQIVEKTSSIFKKIL